MGPALVGSRPGDTSQASREELWRVSPALRSDGCREG